MKLLVIILALVGVALCAEVQVQLPEKFEGRSISSIVVEGIEAFKLQMPCGFPKYGIPVLAPLQTSHQALNMNGESLIFSGEINDFILHELDNFDIDEFRVNALLSKVNFDFVWKNPNLETDYIMWMQRLFGLNMNAQRDGPAKFALNDFRVWGEIKYRISLSRKLSIRSIDIRASVGEVKSEISNLSSNRIVNKMLNGIIEEWFMMILNENQEQMGQLTDKYLTPLANRIIGDRKIDDIIAWITGGGGGGNAFEECVPPTIVN